MPDLGFGYFRMSILSCFLACFSLPSFNSAWAFLSIAFAFSSLLLDLGFRLDLYPPSFPTATGEKETTGNRSTSRTATRRNMARLPFGKSCRPLSGLELWNTRKINGDQIPYR